MSPRRALCVALVAAVGWARCTPPALARTAVRTTSRPSAPGGAVGARLAKLLGPGTRLRDFAPFTTERGEPAFLVLFVTNPTPEPSPDETIDTSQPLSCYKETEGISLGGIYHVGLIIGGRLINEVQIPGALRPPDPYVELPLRNMRDINYRDWGQGSDHDLRTSANAVEPTKLLKLADYNGDGHAWEFRLVETAGTCGPLYTLLAGYSAKQRRAILYPIVSGNDVAYWGEDFFPPPIAPSAQTIHTGSDPCQFDDDPSLLLADQIFEYNQSLEAWVLTDEQSHLCVGGDPAVPTDVQIQIGSVRGRPNEVVSVPVTVGPGGHVVVGFELHLPLDEGLELMGCTAGHASVFSEIKASRSAVDVILSGLCPTNSPSRSCDQLPDRTKLLNCHVEISEDAAPGSHQLAPTSVLLSNGRDHLPAMVHNGAIVVDSDDDATPVR